MRCGFFEALFKGVRTRFGPRTIEKLIDNYAPHTIEFSTIRRPNRVLIPLKSASPGSAF
jgi:hypothetical protein